MTRYAFRLYVQGQTVRSRAAVEQLERLCRACLGTAWEVEVVDVEQHPDRAEQARIVATPTLDRIAPEPMTRVIGDLSSAERLAAALGLPARPEQQEEPVDG